MLVRLKFFSQFVEKLEKLKLSLSKQHNKMLKIRSKMLKIEKNVTMIKLGEIFRNIFPEIYQTPEIPRIFGIPGIYTHRPIFKRKKLIGLVIYGNRVDIY